MMIPLGPTHGDRPRDYLHSVDLALSLILHLRDHGPLTISEAAETLGVAPSTAHRSLSMLVYRGFAARGEGRTYVPGPSLSSISLQPGLGSTLIETVREDMNYIAAATGETCQLTVLSGARCNVIFSIPGQSSDSISARRGQIIPAEQNAGGLAMLAELSAGELRGLYPSMRDDAYAELRRTLRRSRDRGFAINHGLYEPQVSAVGACLRNDLGDVVGAIAVSTPTSRFLQVYHRHAEILSARVREINRTLTAKKP